MLCRVLEKKIVKVEASTPRGTSDEELRVQIVTRMKKYGTVYFITVHHGGHRLLRLESAEVNHYSAYRNIVEKMEKGGCVLKLNENGRAEHLYL